MDKTAKQPVLIPLPVIVFDGVAVKPTKAGVYKCPFKCGNPGFPQQKWRTEGGFRNHMLTCKNRPSLVSTPAVTEPECTCLFLIDGEHAEDCPKRSKRKSFSEFMDSIGQ